MKLDYPLNEDDRISIKNTMFISREITLVGGTYTIQHPQIRSSSIGTVSRKTAGGTTGDLTISISGGQAVINSTSSADTSTVYVIILI